MHQLFDGRTTNGSSTPIDWPSGDGLAQVTGTFDGATCAIQVSLDGGTTYANLSGAAFTAAGTVKIEIPAPVKLRATVTSAGASTSLDCLVIRAQ